MGFFISQTIKMDDLKVSRVIAWIGLLFGGMGCTLTSSDKDLTRKQRPNIVIIMVDDMGYSDIGCYGGEIQTPNIDQLAADGVRFTNFYNNGICVPTRASLLTGLYPQNVGIYTNRPDKYQHSATLGEVLRSAGYRTLMTGKWHALETPYQRGFDRHFGLTDGAANHFNPGPRRVGEAEPGRKISTIPKGYPRRWAVDSIEYQPYIVEDKDFYSTDAFTNYAIDYLEEYKNEEKPFFLYLAFTAPHYPIQAFPADIAKYRGKYMVGWDSLRAARFERQKQLGLIDVKATLPERAPNVPAWESVKDKDAWDLTMSVYAAMVDRIDQNVGKLLAKLDALGEAENTLVIFLSDNGACGDEANYTPDIAPGTMESYRTTDAPWANASNTPYRLYKKWNHEGGIKTPMIARWLNQIDSVGGYQTQIAHVIDFMATFVDISGATYPTELNGYQVKPMDGQSIKTLLTSMSLNGKKRENLYWQSTPGKQRAIRSGDWKLVSEGDDYNNELYNLVTDPFENNNLANSNREKLKELDSMFYEWANRVGIANQKFEEY